jgi:leucyl/phenylalanyl-tRNA---protein transferase
MPVYFLNNELYFPDPDDASDGLLAIGGDLSPARLLLAYEMGIFPWYSPPDPILWWSPDPRCVIFTNQVKVSKSMRNVLNQNRYRITYDNAFEDVMRGCQTVEREEKGTWITEEFIESYSILHQLGVAHSVEVWNGNQLVGGLYGVSLGRMFCGESMFARESNASKVALITLCQELHTRGFEIVDCQIYNDHLGTLGAVEIPRADFKEILKNSLNFDSIRGSWSSWTNASNVTNHD